MNIPDIPADSLPNLSKVAHYRLVRKIGQGGMSVVYEGFDERLKRPIAIKLLHPFLASSPEYKARFLREAEAVARLTHPNIVQIYDICQDEQLYIVTELLSGGTLKEKASQINFIELPELCAMVISQVANALEHAHQKNIIHRDIKPENIMITHEGHIKLMDFGIASIGQEESLTQAGVLLGSLAHAAPEVIKGDKASIRSDIFSLSTVFFWLVSGELPFKGDSPHALLKAIVDNPAQKIQVLSHFISDSLAHIIEQGMDKDPKSRFASAELMAQALEQALLEMGVPLDLNKLRTVLSNPEHEIEGLKSSMHMSIHAQAKAYEKAGNHALALALQCRLDADGTKVSHNPRPPKKFALKIILLATGALGLGLGFCFIKYSGPGPEDIILPAAPREPELASAEQESVIPVEMPSMPEPQIAPPIAKELKLVNQELNISIWPFANIFINNIEVARDAKYKSFKLEPGIYRFKFTHAFAASVEKVVHIKSLSEPQKLTITMNKTKPAFLIIDSALDADIAINGLFKGSSAQSISRPIVIPLPDKTHSFSVELVVQRDGFEPVVQSLRLIAGQTQKVRVTLIPKAISQGALQ